MEIKGLVTKPHLIFSIVSAQQVFPTDGAGAGKAADLRVTAGHAVVHLDVPVGDQQTVPHWTLHSGKVARCPLKY